MTEQRIRVNQEQGERQIPVAQQASERSVCVGGEPSVLHGIDGVSPIATVTQTEDGAVISITDRDGTTTAEIKNGEQGAQGNPGQAATIAVGNTTTGSAGSNATVVNSGTSNAAILDFTIPRGDTGAPGKDGSDGRDGIDGKDGKDGLAATVTVGSTTTGQAGTNASVTNSGTSSAAVLDFTIPRGADGQNGRDGSDGKDGKDGLAATLSVGTVTTGQAGTSASVTNSGTSSAAVFNFTIPRGDTGATGADGYSPTASVSKSGDTATITITDKNGTTTASVTEPTKTSDLTNDGADNTSTYVEADELATVATSGSYNDLSNKPTIPAAQVNSDWSANSGVAQILNKPTLATVATSGSYNDLSNKPTIPTVNNATLTIQKNGSTVNTFTANASSNVTANITVPTSTSGLTNNGADGSSTYVEADDLASVATSGSYNDLSNKPTIPAAQVNSDWNAASGVAQILNKPSLATVATSGLYSDLSGTPTIPTKTSDLTNDGADNTSTYVEADELATVATTGAYGDLSGTPSLATVATTGSYADLTNKPTIPTVNDATLTIQRNGTNVQTFTANASSNVTANISVPTKTSDLTNDGSDNTAQYLETDETAYKTASIPYGECASTSTATAFTATVPGITELRDGVCMLLKNGVVTSASGFTINVNGLGAKPAYSNMAAATRETTAFNINYTIMFVYDSDRVEGGCWVYYRGYYSDSNSVGYQLRTNSSTLPAKEKGYRYRLWLTSADGQSYVPINTATGTSTTSTKALNTTTPIDPFGTIVYNSTNDTVNANANLPNGTQWTQYVLDMRYAKYPLTLTYPDPVYLQCTPQTSGNGALINDIVQALPTTEDGKIYIYLGNAYSATNMELKQDHPVYYFKDGQIRLWSGETVPTLYTTTGQNTDGAVTQKLFSDTVGDVETILQTLNNGGGAQ